MAAVFGLSGSGKSTLTHAKHDGKYPSIKVLHDDAFIINTDTCASIALEPTYFDKTSDYPVDAPDNKYLLTVQNCSATLDEDGRSSASPRTSATATAGPSSPSCGPPTGWIRSTPRSTPSSGS